MAAEVRCPGAPLVEGVQPSSATPATRQCTGAPPHRSRQEGWPARAVRRPRTDSVRSQEQGRTRRPSTARSISPVRATLPFSARSYVQAIVLCCTGPASRRDAPTKPRGAPAASPPSTPAPSALPSRSANNIGHALVVADPGRVARAAVADVRRQQGVELVVASAPWSGTKRTRCSTTSRRGIREDVLLDAVATLAWQVLRQAVAGHALGYELHLVFRVALLLGEEGRAVGDDEARGRAMQAWSTAGSRPR